jgi:hypothetical protein
MRPVDVFVVNVLEQRRRPKGQQRGNVNDWAWWEGKKRNGCRVVFFMHKRKIKKNLDNRQKIDLTLMHACFSSLTSGN